MKKKIKKKMNKPISKKAFPSWGWLVLTIGLVAIIGAVFLQQSQASPVSLSAESTVEQVVAMRDQGVFILDVREPSEWAQFHIPESTLIPLGELSNRLKEIPKDQDIVVVCRSGNRSAQGRDILLAAGFTNVTSMAGGVTEWRTQGYPVDTGE